ncbi:hypothetical protein BU17DRAFT_69473 [Hysterangium stoloniferum]|nr:hypothetical protein BU17DRAFT_69473 [Hysterangium stoloniferum]
MISGWGTQHCYYLELYLAFCSGSSHHPIHRGIRFSLEYGLSAGLNGGAFVRGHHLFAGEHWDPFEEKKGVLDFAEGKPFVTQLYQGPFHQYINYVINGNSSETGFFNVRTAAAQSKIDPSRLQSRVLPYVMRGVEDVKNGKRVVGLGGINKNSGFENSNVDDTEDRQFMAKVRHNVSLPEYTLFGDYSEMVTQYGYVTLVNYMAIGSKPLYHGSVPSQTPFSYIYFIPKQGVPFRQMALKPGDQPDVHTAWHDLMMPALLVALASSYGYLLARDLIRYIMNRAVWDVSPENNQLEASQTEVKSLYLNKMKGELVDSDAITRMAQLAPGFVGDDAFWTNDEGSKNCVKRRKRFKLFLPPTVNRVTHGLFQ